MAKKIYISGSSLVIIDTISSIIDLDKSAKNIYFDNSALKRGSILFTTNEDGVINDGIEFSDSLDANDVAFTEVSFRSFAHLNLGKSSGGSASIPTNDIFNGGFYDYNDLATTASPITVTTATHTLLTNDGAGALTNKTYKPTGDTDVWDVSINSFDWSELKLGDMIDLRLDFDLITTSTNTEIEVDLHLGTGAGAYKIPFISELKFKAKGTYKVNRFNGIYLGDANTLDNGGQFKIMADKNCTVVVNGWYCKIIKIG